MTLVELIKLTKETESLIRAEHKKLKDFQLSHPWLIEDLKEEHNLPDINIEEVLSLKEFFLIDKMEKLYQQIKLTNPLLEERSNQIIYYYKIDKNLYKNQLKKGFELGDKDKRGFFVSGSNLIMESVVIDTKDFLSNYYTLNN